MANVHGFRDVNNQNNNNRGGQGGNNFNINRISDELPFMNTMRTDKPPMDQTIPYTLKIVCCPDFKPFSVTVIFLIIIWIMYIFCLIQGIQEKNGDVLEVKSQTLQNMGGAKGTLILAGQIYRLLSASILHVTLMHIVMNSISLLFLVSRFQKLYKFHTILIMIGASITGFMLSVLCSRDTLTVGASTPIFGILGGFIAFLIINWKALERYGPVRGSLACIIGVIVFISLIFSIGSSIDAIAHIGGLIGGLFISLAILPGLELKSKMMTYVGLGAFLVMNLITFLIFFISG